MAAGVVAAVGGKLAATGITQSLTREPERPGRRKRYPGCSVRLLSARFDPWRAPLPLRTLAGHQRITAPSDLNPPPQRRTLLRTTLYGSD
jgi:hypothetical protein